MLKISRERKSILTANSPLAITLSSTLKSFCLKVDDPILAKERCMLKLINSREAG